MYLHPIILQQKLLFCFIIVVLNTYQRKFKNITSNQYWIVYILHSIHICTLIVSKFQWFNKCFIPSHNRLSTSVTKVGNVPTVIINHIILPGLLSRTRLSPSIWWWCFNFMAWFLWWWTGGIAVVVKEVFGASIVLGRVKSFSWNKNKIYCTSWVNS